MGIVLYTFIVLATRLTCANLIATPDLRMQLVRVEPHFVGSIFFLCSCLIER